MLKIIKDKMLIFLTFREVYLHKWNYSSSKNNLEILSISKYFLLYHVIKR